jgi:hypothetical protein
MMMSSFMCRFSFMDTPRRASSASIVVSWDLLRIRAGGEQAACDQRPFGRRIARQHRPVARGIGQGGGAKPLDEVRIRVIRAAHHGTSEFWGAVTLAAPHFYCRIKTALDRRSR